MRYRNSLRFRIFLVFVGAGLLLGPLLAYVFLTVSNELEELVIAKVLVGKLQQIMAAPDASGFVSHPGSPSLHIFGDIPAGDVPLELEGKNGIFDIGPEGDTEYEAPLSLVNLVDPKTYGRSWIVAVGSQAGVTFVLAADQTTIEIRESLVNRVVAVGTFFSVCVSLWVGYLFTKRLIRPLQQLAAATASGSDDETGQINPEDYPADEIGQLATALKHDRIRRTEALIREKAFSAEVAHELRNPLAVIQSTMEIIERDAGLASASERALDRALAAAGEMSETLAALMLLGRERAASATYPPVDLTTVVKRVVDMNTAHSNVDVDWEQIATPVLEAPEAAIRMIADNLVRNAVQNTPSGKITVSLTSDRLIVRDTGIGINPSELQTIRLHGVRGSNTRGTGSGLGLALVDRLCMTFGWNLDIQSQLDEGTTATWRFG